MYLDQLQQSLNPGLTDYRARQQQNLASLGQIAANGVQNGMQIKSAMDAQREQAASNAQMQQAQQQQQPAGGLLGLGLSMATGGIGGAIGGTGLLAGIGQTVQEKAADSLMPLAGSVFGGNGIANSPYGKYARYAIPGMNNFF